MHAFRLYVRLPLDSTARAGGAGRAVSGPPTLEAWGEDLAVIERVLAGDDQCFAALMARYYGSLLRLARVFVADRPAAEEIVQETWLDVLHGLRSFEGGPTLKAWILKVLAENAKMRAGRERWTTTPSAASMEPGADDEPAVNPVRFTPAGRWSAPPDSWENLTPDALPRMEALGQMALEELLPMQQAVVTLRDVEGLDLDEICRVLEITETDARLWLHRGRSKLRAALERSMNARKHPRVI